MVQGVLFVSVMYPNQPHHPWRILPLTIIPFCRPGYTNVWENQHCACVRNHHHCCRHPILIIIKIHRKRRRRRRRHPATHRRIEFCYAPRFSCDKPINDKVTISSLGVNHIIRFPNNHHRPSTRILLLLRLVVIRPIPPWPKLAKKKINPMVWNWPCRFKIRPDVLESWRHITKLFRIEPRNCYTIVFNVIGIKMLPPLW